MTEKLLYECGLCHRTAPSGSMTLVRGVPLGPTCLKRLRRREHIRASGSNPRVILEPETKLPHTVSDHGDVCPDDQIHCLSCPHLTDIKCPIEQKYGHQYNP